MSVRFRSLRQKIDVRSMKGTEKTGQTLLELGVTFPRLFVIIHGHRGSDPVKPFQMFI